jgi:hypothetical protein
LTNQPKFVAPSIQMGKPQLSSLGLYHLVAVDEAALRLKLSNLEVSDSIPSPLSPFCLTASVLYGTSVPPDSICCCVGVLCGVGVVLVVTLVCCSGGLAVF